MENRQIYSSSEVRALKTEDDKMIVEGYAIVFNSESRDLGGFTEIVSPEALNGALERNNDVLALYDHNYGQILGRQSSETLKLEKDERGLRFTLDLPNTQLGRDVFTLVNRGDLKGNSFGFTVRKDDWSKEDGKVKRTIEEIGDLFEISIVSMPAYDATELTKRSFDEFVQTEINVESKEIEDEAQTYPHSILKFL